METLVKTLFILSLLTLFSTSSFAATAIKLSCSLRQNVTISSFKYQLSTMKWGDHFQIASGVRHAKTQDNIPFLVTRFKNGDNLIEFETSQEYFMVYADSETPDRCYLKETFTYDIIDLPRYHKSQITVS
nr:hypothetical protein [Lelliottia sp. WAP21]